MHQEKSDLDNFFICFSPFRFGDQILALGRNSVAGWDREKVKYILKFTGLNMRLINWWKTRGSETGLKDVINLLYFKTPD